MELPETEFETGDVPFARADGALPPALIPAPQGALVAITGEPCRTVPLSEARALFQSGAVVVAHAAYVAGRLQAPPRAPLFDVIELFAFVRPGVPCAPGPIGLARALGLPVPENPQELPRVLLEAAATLLDEIAGWSAETRANARPIAALLTQNGWRWGEAVLARLGPSEKSRVSLNALSTWRGLPEWDDEPPPAKPSSLAVDAGEVRARLAVLIGDAGEQREEQADYAQAAAYAFGARGRAGAPLVALAEAGTGIGKTLGYLAPASLWAEKNGAGVWLSTYTRNLQRQIAQELARLYPDPAERDEKTVVRKGRENYLCLLNFEEALKRTALAPGQRLIALALIARWIAATPDGDMTGAGFPSFLAASTPLGELTDRRGECVYGACAHYRTCFIERVARKARRAPLVVANHALVISQALQNASADDAQEDVPEARRLRFVFDEGHHLFDAADSGFSAFLSGREMADLRRWIRGAEGRTRSRARGLEERLRELVRDDDLARSALDDAALAASSLAGDGWMARVQSGMPKGAGEIFLAAVQAHVAARSDDQDALYSREAGTESPQASLIDAAHTLAERLRRLAAPMMRLAAALRAQLDTESDELESVQRGRIEAAARGIERRARLLIPAWIGMLDTLEESEEDFIQWFEIARDDGRDVDAGLRRHWIDPTIPFARSVLAPAHGALITSATLRDAGSDDDWQAAEVRTGANHLPEPARRAQFGSPFNFAEQARIFVVRDVARRDMDQLAAAMRELFLASRGGALGLFTSVRALRAVEARIHTPLAEAGLSLYAQHVDRLDTGALVDLFRVEDNACLLGTDALRDGVDVPGRSLRLVVFDKVPWPRPTILHKARRARFGRSYDDLITRLRLKQAFGRLIRSKNDRGCFVILESATPSRLLTAFPPDAPVLRCGLAEAIRGVDAFLGER
jgi:ATP-dependent DNA helicase DinG